ncbi:MAG: MFS transporter [Rhizobiaceae bacterium]|nr:MFS transporter [Rhizobiaceae bacterium]
MRWRSAAAAIASISVVGVAIGLGMPLLSIILEQRGYAASLIGLNSAVGGVVSIVAAPIAVPLAARFGVVPSMVGSILLGGMSFLGFYFIESFAAWFVLRAVLHVALTVLFILSEFWITSSAPPQRRGLLLGVYTTCLSLGFAIGPMLLAYLGSGGFAPFGLAFVLVMAAAIPVIGARAESPVIARHDGSNGRSLLPFIFLVPTATAAVLVYGAVETGGFALFPVYGTRIGYSEAETALLLTMIGLGNVLLQIPIGIVSDWMRDRRVLLVICAAVGLSGMIAMPFVAGNWWAAAGLLFVWGGVVAGLYTVGFAHLGARLTGRDLAMANAAFVFCYGVGMLAGPQAIGVGMDLWGPDGFAWTLAAFFAAYIALAGARLVRNPRRT